MSKMTNKELHEIAKAIAPLIGYEYKPADNVSNSDWPNSDGLNSWAKIEGANGALGLTVNEGWGAKKGRMVINVAWPRGKNYQAYTVSSYDRKNRVSEITVSLEKSPAQIANDIRRRLLTDAESLYIEARAAKERDEEYTAKRRAAIRLVGELVGKPVSERDLEDDRRGHFYIGKSVNHSVSVSSANSIKVEIGANIGNIEKIIEFVKSLEEVQ